MKKLALIATVALAVATILTVAFLPQLALAISQRWYLTDIASYVMNRGAAGGTSNPITVTKAASEIWVADEAASLPVTFPTGDWTGQIEGTAPSGAGDTATVEIGSWNGSTFTSAGTSGTMTFTGGTISTQPFTITGASQFTVSQTNWLALRLNNTTANKSLDVETGGNSYVNSPSTDPGYPSPWESYNDGAHANVWGTVGDPYTSATQTAYMYGTGFVPSNYYDIYYYDGNGDLVTAANDINVQATAAGNLESAYLLNFDPGAAQGLWNSGVLDNPGSPPATWQTSGWIAYDLDGLQVNQSAIPEFPTIMAAIGVAGLCFGIYYWMRRKRLAYVKA